MPSTCDFIKPIERLGFLPDPVKSTGREAQRILWLWAKGPNERSQKAPPPGGVALRCKRKTAYATVPPLRSFPGWSHRLAWPRTEPSQGLNTGSNPVGTTKLSLDPVES
jgi:hypothetical protein